MTWDTDPGGPGRVPGHLLDRVPGLGILLFDRDLRFRLARGGAFPVAGYPPDEIEGRTLHEVLPADAASLLEPYYRRAIAGEGSALEFPAPGTARIYDVRFGPITGDDGEVAGGYALIRDVTDVRAREAAVRVLAGGIAHDFNNLLLAVLGNTSLARDAIEHAPDLARQRLNDVELAANQAADLTRSLLAYAGRASVARVPVDVADAVRDAARRLRRRSGPGTEVTVDVPASLPAVDVDPGQFHQALRAVLDNAAEAAPGRPIRVSCNERVLAAAELAAGAATPPPEPGCYVVVSVVDAGRGMDEATRGRAFEPFFSTKAIGRGLGLAAALGIVRAHGGTMLLGTARSGGLEVSIALPCSGDAAA